MTIYRNSPTVINFFHIPFHAPPIGFMVGSCSHYCEQHQDYHFAKQILFPVLLQLQFILHGTKS